MKKSVIAMLLFVVILFSSNYVIAYANAYDTYKEDAKKAEEVMRKYEEENTELQAYLDAVASGNQSAWEAARKKSAVSKAVMMNSGKSEVDAVKNQISTNEMLIKNYRSRFTIAEHKADIYFHAYILQDTVAINAFLSNGLRTIPADISNNIYYTWPSVEVPEGCFSDESVFYKNCGNVFLATATILDNSEKSVYLIDINGEQARAMISNENVDIGDIVNVYFTPYIMGKDALPLIVVGAQEEEIDYYHYMREK